MALDCALAFAVAVRTLVRKGQRRQRNWGRS